MTSLSLKSNKQAIVKYKRNSRENEGIWNRTTSNLLQKSKLPFGSGRYLWKAGAPLRLQAVGLLWREQFSSAWVCSIWGLHIFSSEKLNVKQPGNSKKQLGFSFDFKRLISTFLEQKVHLFLLIWGRLSNFYFIYKNIYSLWTKATSFTSLQFIRFILI